MVYHFNLILTILGSTTAVLLSSQLLQEAYILITQYDFHPNLIANVYSKASKVI